MPDAPVLAYPACRAIDLSDSVEDGRLHFRHGRPGDVLRRIEAHGRLKR